MTAACRSRVTGKARPHLSGSAIADSAGRPAATAIDPDVATCPECLAELFDPASRRWRHAFITCTHCGPRYTVTRALPFGRPRTSLAGFPLCSDCAAEYAAPRNRRFHAETTCCPACGPKLSLLDSRGRALSGDPIGETLALMQLGGIAAIKGLGGFHLACDARNAQAVARLRLRENGAEKPLSVMMANVASVTPYAAVSSQERGLLESRERPVVLLQMRRNVGETCFPGVAPGLNCLGVMLPATPIQFLLFHEAAGRPAGCGWLDKAQEMVLVMTGANPGGEPIVRDGAEAGARLADIADAILDHDREIVARCEDSVIRAQHPSPQFLRRSRGYAPGAIRLPAAGPSVLAFGAHLRNSVCLTRGDEAFVSPHIGDLDNAAACAFLDRTARRMLSLLDARPQLVAHDLDPDDYSTSTALGFAAAHDIPAIAVQHHHAHIAAVCAEHRWREPVLGLALDGVGVGTDGTAWGGELLRVDGALFERLGHLKPLPSPGGDQAASEPWRIAAAVLHQLGRNGQIAQRFSGEPGAGGVADQLARGLSCPRSSSMGRVFDAAAGLLGLCPNLKYEAQAAMLLEQAAMRAARLRALPQPIAGGWVLEAGGQLDLLPLLASLEGSDDADRAAARFHTTLAAALADWVLRAAEATGLKSVAWGGGCFLNSLLAAALRQRLENGGLAVLAPRLLSPGNASISVGQAWVAIQAAEN
jgi:hydrogenase maturation protein HypF